jgi:hypothetical protein
MLIILVLTQANSSLTSPFRDQIILCVVEQLEWYDGLLDVNPSISLAKSSFILNLKVQCMWGDCNIFAANLYLTGKTSQMTMHLLCSPPFFIFIF